MRDDELSSDDKGNSSGGVDKLALELEDIRGATPNSEGEDCPSSSIKAVGEAGSSEQLKLLICLTCSMPPKEGDN